MTHSAKIDPDCYSLSTSEAHACGENSMLLDKAMIAHYSELCSTVQRRGHAANVNDIVHDLYVRLRDSKTSLENRASLRTFLMRAAINLGLDRFRRERLEARLFAGSAQEAEQIAAQNTLDPDNILDIPRRLTLLREAIMEMPLKQRRVFIASRIANLSPDEIACRFGITRNMVDRHLRKALIHCLDRLDDLNS